jgi:serine/threonine-protein kinase
MADSDEGKQLPGTAYRLKRKLGAGGMGTVWVAEHVDLGRNDAVKLLAAQLLDDPEAFERLKREARATAQLGNPHIIDIYTMGLTTDGMPYVAMRLVQGPNLRELQSQDRHMPIARAWSLMRPVCLALQDAHEARIVHRDLKPENIMVETRRGEAFPVILDFGIAKSLLETDRKITREGDVIGTPGYMAPEQALGKVVDGRADQYSVAVMLYELVSTELPVNRGGPLQMLAQQITQPPRRLRELVSVDLLPDGAEAVIMRALDRERSGRFDDLNAFVDAMDAALVGLWAPPRGTVEFSGAVPPRAVSAVAEAFDSGAGQGPLASPPPAPPTARTQANAEAASGSRPRWLWIAGGVLVTGLGAAAAFVSLSSGSKTETVPTAESAAPPVVAVASAPPTAPQVVAPATVVAPPVAQASEAAASVAPTSPTALSPPPPSPSARGTSPPSRRVAAAASEAPAPTPPSETPPPPLPRSTVEPTAPPTAAPVVAAPVPATAAPTAAPPVVRPVVPRVVASSKVQGGASTAELKRALQQIERRAQACVTALPALAVGQAAQVDFGVDGDGFFTAPVVTGEVALARCLSGAVKGVSRLERRPDTGEVRVRYELRLEAP